MGYHRAGFDVVGVDIQPQPNYPFQFVRANALQWPVFVDEFDAIHASPPCQAYSLATLYHGRSNARKHPDLVAPTRVRLDSWGLPYVIENVPGSPVRSDVVLCGEMFGLRVHRHRVFELGGWFAMRPPHGRHVLKGAVTNCHVQEGMARLVAGNYANHEDASDAMGIDWMTRKELAEAIPPAYTQWIGERLLAHLSTTEGVRVSDILSQSEPC